MSCLRYEIFTSLAVPDTSLTDLHVFSIIRAGRVYLRSMPRHQSYDGIGSRLSPVVTHRYQPNGPKPNGPLFDRIPNLPKVNFFCVRAHSLVHVLVDSGELPCK
jgi:hypothetical protein